jgi:type IV secretory pathway VirD2 relaxase
MSDDPDKPVERPRRVRPGRIRAERSEGRGLLLRKLSASAQTRPTRSRTRGRALQRPGYGPSARQQRSVVKVQYVANRSPGGWRAHGRYLAREGAQREGEKGLGFDAESTQVEIDRRIDGWQRADDPRLWKMILSPERGDALDLVEHTRRVIDAMERDLGTRLEWVAVDHRNTAHPHVHVAIRGRDEVGRPLLLDREYVKHGLRARSRELATQALGYRTEADRFQAREQALTVRRFGELDAVLEQRMGPGRLVSFEDPVPASERAAALRLQLIGRLQFLEGLGLAAKAGSKTWRLAPEHRPALREMQILGDVQKNFARGDLSITDPGALRALVRLEPGTKLRGRVGGTTSNELGETPFLVLEATDGRVLLVPQTPVLAERRGEGGLQRGHVVTIEEHEVVADGRRIRWTEVQEHGRLRDLVRIRELATVLDIEALERARSHARTVPPAPARGFGRAWNRAVEARLPLLAEAGLVVRAGPENERAGNSGWLALPQAMPQVSLRTKQREGSALTFEEVQTTSGKRLEEGNRDLGQYEGKLVAWARDAQGRHHLVLDVGPYLVAIPSQRQALERGAQVRVRYERPAAEQGLGLHAGWQVIDRERELDRGRGR